MHHKCVKCGKIYEHAAEEIINGCSCGSKLFFFVKSRGAKKIQENVDYFYEADEADVKNETDNDALVFDIEAINVKSNGKYELNIDSLMNNEGLIYRYGEGKYSVDLETNMKKLKRKK